MIIKRILKVYITKNGRYKICFYNKQNLCSISKTNYIPYIFKTNDFENIIFATKLLHSKKIIKKYKTSIYLKNNSYYFVIKIPIKDNKTPILLNEYFEYSLRGERLSSIIEEYFKPLIKNSAINVINKYFKVF